MMTMMTILLALVLSVALIFVGSGISPHRKRYSLLTAAIALADEILRPLCFSRPKLAVASLLFSLSSLYNRCHSVAFAFASSHLLFVLTMIFNSAPDRGVCCVSFWCYVGACRISRPDNPRHS